MTDKRPLGTLQVDVDDLWVYYESIGLPTPGDAPAQAYLEGIPRLLDLFDRFGVRATFFVCGRDLPAQTQTVMEMTRRGHEVANHSTGHRNGFARLSPAEKRADIAATGVLIAQATGQRPVGFKSPGFSFSPDLLEVLADLGYLYDSSLLPTPYAPLLRSLYRGLSARTIDPTHFGQAINGLAPLTPYRPDSARPYRRAGSEGAVMRKTQDTTAKTSTRDPEVVQTTAFWEAPVTAMPFTRLPMHSTFVLRSGRWLFDLGMVLVRARGVPINYLLHAADVLEAVADPALASYGFLMQPWAKKRPLYEHMLETLSMAYRLVPTCDFVQAQVPDVD
jgi:peptidoglycan-N-acetylglucosamine deacetylase